MRGPSCTCHPTNVSKDSSGTTAMQKADGVRLFPFKICLCFLLGLGGHGDRPFCVQNAFLLPHHQAQSRFPWVHQAKPCQSFGTPVGTGGSPIYANALIKPSSSFQNCNPGGGAVAEASDKSEFPLFRKRTAHEAQLASLRAHPPSCTRPRQGEARPSARGACVLCFEDMEDRMETMDRVQSNKGALRQQPMEIMHEG